MKKQTPRKSDEWVGLSPSFHFLRGIENRTEHPEVALIRFFEFETMGAKVPKFWAVMSYILKEVVPALKDGDWGEIKYGQLPQHKVHVTSKADFIHRFIDPVLERGREVMAAYDEVSVEARQAYDRAVEDRASVIVRADAGMGTVEASRQRGNETRQAISAYRAENPAATQQEIADAVGISRSRVADIDSEGGGSVDSVSSAKDTESTPESQSERARKNGITRQRQSQLDAIARLNPDLIPKIKIPNNPTGTISISKAYQEATGRKPLKRHKIDWTERDDLEAVVVKIQAKIKSEFGEDAIVRFGAIWEGRQ